jgi:nucleoside-diphosphate-sugar epimerase
MKVLVTGHEGYIGSVLTPLLRQSGHQVVGVDCGYFREGDGKDTSLRKDVRDLTETDLAGCEAVIHLAALSNDPMGNLQPELTYAINYRASVRLAELAKEAGVHRFLFSSSCSVYGLASADEFATEESPLNPLTPYAISKVRTEEDVSRLADGSFSPVFLRNATVYGWSPRFRSDLVLNNLAGWAYTTKEIRILSDGTPWRPIAHVQDIAGAFLSMLEAPREAVHNQVFNVGADAHNYQVRQLAETVERVFPGSQVEYAQDGGPDPRSYRVDFSKLAQRVPEYHPRWDAAQGAAELLGAYRQTQLTFEDFNGPRYVRLAQLKQLVQSGALDETLRWRN